MVRMKLKLSLASCLLASALCLPFAFAEEFHCEVLAVEGSAVLKSGNDLRPARQGDLLNDGDTIETQKGAMLILAFDKEWKNVAQVEEDSVVRIQSVLPSVLYLNAGGLFAKLKELPEGSTFSVETPTAIAAVRGTEYRTVVDDSGTEVFNVSDSDVYVFAKDSTGDTIGVPVILESEQKTRCADLGSMPQPPRPMSDSDRGGAFRVKERVEKHLQDNVSRGRVGKIQDVGRIREFLEERKIADRSGGRALVSMDQSERSDRRRQDGRMLERSGRLLDLMQKAQDYRPQRDVSYGAGGAPILPSTRITGPPPGAFPKAPEPQGKEPKKPDENRPRPKPAPRKN